MEFPEWVEGPTACATRTFKVVLPSGTPHRALHTNVTVPNDELFLVRLKENGKLFMSALRPLARNSLYEIEEN